MNDHVLAVLYCMLAEEFGAQPDLIQTMPLPRVQFILIEHETYLI